ncbi:hypothetical protein Syun_005386 [Stephania yunnanensis]|uniref:J domain-containing protein n=1 Tax=Stephania yunnanensis TaxID=152371 RepID=A0AAP0Q3E6_9MAGN
MVSVLPFSNSSLCTPSPKLAIDGAPANTARVRFRSVRVSARGDSNSICCSRMSSAYDVLGIPIGASHDEIKIAYRRLARVCHPDVVSMNLKDRSADEFMKIHAAYSTLSDPEKRADYDRKLSVSRRSSDSSFSSFASWSTATASAVSGISRYGRRTWETDQCW